MDPSWQTRYAKDALQVTNAAITMAFSIVIAPLVFVLSMTHDREERDSQLLRLAGKRDLDTLLRGRGDNST